MKLRFTLVRISILFIVGRDPEFLIDGESLLFSEILFFPFLLMVPPPHGKGTENNGRNLSFIFLYSYLYVWDAWLHIDTLLKIVYSIWHLFCCLRCSGHILALLYLFVGCRYVVTYMDSSMIWKSFSKLEAIVHRLITCFLEILLIEDFTQLRHFCFYLPWRY